MNLASLAVAAITPTPQSPDPVILLLMTDLGAWKVATPSPLDAEIIVKSIVYFEDGPLAGSAKVYGLPLPGTGFAKELAGFEYTIPAVSVRLVVTLAKFDVLKELEDIAVANAAGGEDSEEPEDGDEPTAPTAPAASPAVVDPLS